MAANSSRTTSARVAAGPTPAYAEPLCQSILGTEIDAAVGQLLVDAVTPLALEMALAVQHEIQARFDDADRVRHRQVERAQYEADRARHRYMQVDPANRLVADSLEADWNGRRRALAEAQEEYRRQRTADRVTVDSEHRERILALAADFNARGLRTGAGDAFDSGSVQWVRFSAGLTSFKGRLLAAGMLTGAQIAAKLGVRRTTIGRWRRQGRLTARICNEMGEWLYAPPQDLSPHGTRPSPPGAKDRSPVGGAV